ncbi:MAG: hypothetical protein LAT61_07240 [Alcanivorax sp.]|nr:hypothetical protein [Alcanivorax sp.]
MREFKTSIRLILFVLVAWFFLDYLAGATTRNQSNQMAMAGHIRNMLENQVLIFNRRFMEHRRARGVLPGPGDEDFCFHDQFCPEFLEVGVYLLTYRGHGVLIDMYDEDDGGFDCFISVPYFSGPHQRSLLPDCSLKSAEWFEEQGVTLDADSGQG